MDLCPASLYLISAILRSLPSALADFGEAHAVTGKNGS